MAQGGLTEPQNSENWKWKLPENVYVDPVGLAPMAPRAGIIATMAVVLKSTYHTLWTYPGHIETLESSKGY